MKSIGLFFACLLFVASISSCKKNKDLSTFEIRNTSEITVPDTAALNVLLTYYSPDIKTSSAHAFESNNTKTQLVKDIRLSNVELTIPNPAGMTFGFLKSVKIYISGNGLPELLLASKETIAEEPGKTISLDLTDEKMDSYIKMSSYSLRYEVVTDETFQEDITMKAAMIYTVTAASL